MNRYLSAILLASSALAADVAFRDVSIDDLEQVGKLAAVYPAIARKAGVTGIVVVEAIVRPDGTVAEVKLLKSIPLLDEAALTAVRAMRFEEIDAEEGQPPNVRVSVPVTFQVQRPGEEGSPPPVFSHDWDLESGIAFVAGREHAKAVPVLEKAAMRLKKSAEPTFYLALAHQGLGDRAKAREWLQLSVEREPGHARSHRELGLVLLEAREGAAAKRSLERYLELSPDAADAATIRSMIAKIVP